MLKLATEVQKFFVIAEDFKVISGFSWKQRKNIWLSLIDGDNKLIANDFRAAISAAKTFFYTEDRLSVLRFFFFKSDSRNFVLKYFFAVVIASRKSLAITFKSSSISASNKYDFKQAL